MKILLVNYEYPPLGGGGGIAMMEFAKELARRHEVHVLTSGLATSDTVNDDSHLNLTIHRVRVFGRSERATASIASMAAFLPLGIRRGNELAAKINFDVINTWFAIPTGIAGGWIAKKNGIPHVLTVIGGDIYDPSKWYSPHRFIPTGLAVKWSLRHADAHLAISSDIARRTRQYFDFQKPIEVIALGITEPEFKPATREQLGMLEEKKYVVAVGRLVRRKDYPTLLRAIHSLARDDTDLLLLGDGPEKKNLLRLAQELGIADRVHLKGFVSDEIKYQILSNSDVFALVSLHEGFGIVYLEAMYCGLPIVAADEGGQVDILDAAVTGDLVPIHNVQALSDSLTNLLGDDQALRKIGIDNRARFDNYSISSLAGRYELSFEKLIDKVAASVVDGADH